VQAPDKAAKWPNKSQPRVALVSLASELAQELIYGSGLSELYQVPEVESAAQAMQEAGRNDPSSNDPNTHSNDPN
jgi:hypothetical protein